MDKVLAWIATSLQVATSFLIIDTLRIRNEIQNDCNSNARWLLFRDANDLMYRIDHPDVAAVTGFTLDEAQH